MPGDVDACPEGRCSFCGGPASGSGKAKLLVYSKDQLVAVCGKCVDSHAELLRHLEGPSIGPLAGALEGGGDDRADPSVPAPMTRRSGAPPCR
jgi:hypothetical protein